MHAAHRIITGMTAQGHTHNACWLEMDIMVSTSPFWRVCLIGPESLGCNTETHALMQIATIGLAASVDVLGVTLGGILGHAICTGAAVLGGRHLATHIHERTVGIVGGVLFILFGLHALWEGPDH